MKKIIAFTLILCFAFLNVFAQQDSDIAMRAAELNSTDSHDYIKKYTLEFVDLTSEMNNKKAEEEHFLGTETSKKWNMFRSNYRREYSQSIGLTNSSIEIVKPTVFNAVVKINNFYKKELKKGVFSKVEITKDFNHILDCANLIFYENNTKNIEDEIKSSGSIEELIKVFKSIEIIKN